MDLLIAYSLSVYLLVFVTMQIWKAREKGPFIFWALSPAIILCCILGLIGFCTISWVDELIGGLGEEDS